VTAGAVFFKTKHVHNDTACFWELQHHHRQNHRLKRNCKLFYHRSRAINTHARRSKEDERERKKIERTRTCKFASCFFLFLICENDTVYPLFALFPVSWHFRPLEPWMAFVVISIFFADTAPLFFENTLDADLGVNEEVRRDRDACIADCIVNSRLRVVFSTRALLTITAIFQRKKVCREKTKTWKTGLGFKNPKPSRKMKEKRNSPLPTSAYFIPSSFL